MFGQSSLVGLSGPLLQSLKKALKVMGFIANDFVTEMIDEMGIAVAVFVGCLLLTQLSGISVTETAGEVIVTVAWYRKLLTLGLSVVAIGGFIKFMRRSSEKTALKFWLLTFLITGAQTYGIFTDHFLVNKSGLEYRSFSTEFVPWTEITSLSQGTSRKGKPCLLCQTSAKTYEWSNEMTDPAVSNMRRIATELKIPFK